MTGISKPTFSSPLDFCIRLVRLFKLPLFTLTFLKVDPLTREKILLTISMANQCKG